MDAIVFEICNLVKECGQVFLNAHLDSMDIRTKVGDANFVTEYDTRIQELLHEGLKQIIPTASFVGEEGALDLDTSPNMCFLVDPIDGTTNFIKNYHMSCISVALLENKIVQIGVIYNPYLDELFYAKRGSGAFCNNDRIRVSSNPLSNGIVLFGTSPYKKELSEESFALAYKYFKKSLDIRRSGSAALDLCAIAAGRAELYFELCLSPWDYAAGSLIVEEAGGYVSTIDGFPLTFDQQNSILARNRQSNILV